MWMDEAKDARMNVARSQELLNTGAQKVVTACPFCATMIGDGIASLGQAAQARVLDVAEVLDEVCQVTTAEAARQTI